MNDENNFFGLKVPEGPDRRELYKRQYRALFTYKCSAADLDGKFREAIAVSEDGAAGWSIKNDERQKYVGKLEVSKEDTTLKVTFEDYPEAGMSALKYYTIQSYTK